jgi:hypothetical protein
MIAAHNAFANSDLCQYGYAGHETMTVLRLPVCGEHGILYDGI